MKNMTLNDLKKIVDEEVAKGNGEAIVMVQANADHISDIIINGYEGCGNEFGDGPLVFSLESNPSDESDYSDDNPYEECSTCDGDLIPSDFDTAQIAAYSRTSKKYEIIEEK